MEISIVIPMLDEADNVRLLVEELDRVLPALGRCEIVLVDDGSSDGTAEVIRGLIAERSPEAPALRLVQHPRPVGQSGALRSGIRAARAPWIVTLDGDGQNDPADIPTLVAVRDARGGGRLLVMGERTRRHDSWVKRASSRIANAVRGSVLRDGVRDTGCALKLFPREDFLTLPFFDHLHRFLPALFRGEGLTVVTVPVGHRSRHAGRSKYGIGNRLWVGVVDLVGVAWLLRRRVLLERPARPREELDETTKEPPPSRREWALLAALAILILGSGLGMRHPWPADEPRFPLVAHEMLVSGDFLFPHRAGELYPDKPPVFMWIEAAILALTGSLALTWQLPSLGASLLTLLLVVDLGRRLWGPRAGWWCGVAALAIVQFPLQAHSGQIDATLAACTTLGLYGLCRHLLLGPSWRWYWLGCAAMGLGIITKGVGFLPLLVIPLWWWARRRGWAPLSAPRGIARWALGPLLLLAVVSAWAVPMILAARGNPELEAYRDEILLGQTAERYVAPSGHHRPPWYYLTSVIPGMWLPASLALPWLLPRWRRRLRAHDARLLVLLGWIALVVLFFSLSGGKRGVYLLPAVPALALAVGPQIPHLLRRRGLNLAAWLLLAVLALAMATGLVLALSRSGPLADPELANLAPALPALAALGLVMTAAPLFLGPRRGLAGLVAMLGFAWLAYGWGAFPLLDGARSGRDLMQSVAQALAPTDELAMVGWREQLILHADRRVAHFGFDNADPDGEKALGKAPRAAAWLRQAPGRQVLLPADLLSPCFFPERARSVGIAHGREWMLVDAAAEADGCPRVEVGVVFRSAEPLRPASSAAVDERENRIGLR